MLSSSVIRCFVCIVLLIQPFFAFAQCWPRSQKLVPLKSPNTSESFGSSIDHDGNIAVVGAPSSDTVRTSSGVVYVFEFKNNTWTKLASLTPSDHREGQSFGQQVLIQGDYIFVADPRRQSGGGRNGAVYIYKKPATGWHDMVQTSILLPNYPYAYLFGVSMAVFENHLIVGAPYSFNAANVQAGAAFIFELQGNVWTQIATLKSPHVRTSTFGSNVALSRNTAVVVADEEQRSSYTAVGAVYVFEKTDSDPWTDAFPNARLTESSGNESIARLGSGLAIDESRNTIFVTQIVWDNVSGYKAVQVYRKPGVTWADMTESVSYRGVGNSQVYFQKLRFEEPYLYSGGGKYVEVFTADASNQWSLSSPVASLTNSEFTLQQQFGQDIAVKDGRVLISAPAVVTLDRDTLIAPAAPAIYDFQTPVTGWLPAGNLEDRSFSYLPQTATDYFFGMNVKIDRDIAIVGSPDDNISRNGAGAVYVYQLVNFHWNKIATLTPTDGEPYDDFGRYITINNDYIVVGTPDKHYRDATGKIVDHSLGAVYIFKKPATGWTDMNETYKVIRNEGKPDYTDSDRDDDNLGVCVAFDYPYLLAARYDQYSRPNGGEVLVFNLSGATPVYEATLKPSFEKNNFGKALVIRDSTIVIGAGGGRVWFLEGAHAFVYLRRGDHWRDTTESAVLIPHTNTGSAGAFGESVDITEDGSEIIVGAPGWLDGVIFETTDYFKGAAYIYERPIDGWKGHIAQVAELTVPGQPAYGCMGQSVHIEDRYVVVGSPQNYWHTLTQNPGPGRVYFYEKPPGGWTYKLPDKILQGDEVASPLSDYFGSSVDGVFGYLMVGAMADDNQNNVDAGAAYVYTEYPFINPAPSPICENAPPIQLTAIPPGGTWEGNGLLNNHDGIFYPTLAGIGKQRISYKVDGCNSSNSLLLTVKDVPKEQVLIDKDSIFFCGKSQVFVEVPFNRRFEYSWEFSDDGESYSKVASNVGKLTVENGGLYKIVISNECAMVDDTVWVGDLYPDGGEDFSTCISDVSRQLIGNYPSGTWSSQGTERISPSGLFDPKVAGNGTHQLYFSVSPYAACVYRDTVIATVFKLKDFRITPTGTQTFCFTGESSLSLTPSPSPSTDITWYFGTAADDLRETGSGDAHIRIARFGFYKAVVSDGQCSAEQLYEFITPPFRPAIMPTFDSLAFCEGSPIKISAESIENADYIWLIHRNGAQELLAQSYDSFSEIIDESGKFTLRIESHGCVFESDEMVAWKIPGDSVFVPNVVTPNGDQWNEYFEVYLESGDEFSMKVFNRYGQEVWSGDNANPRWDPSEAAAGTYFWMLTSHSKCSDRKVTKGWVQVLKE